MTHPYRSAEPTAPTPWTSAWMEHFVWRARRSRREILVGAAAWIFLAALAGVATFMIGCTNPAIQIQAHTADSIAEAANSTLPMLIQRYREEGFRELERLKAEGGATQDDANAALAVVKARWKPIWAAWDALSVAQDAWADALETGGALGPPLKALKEAYCQLRAVWPKDIPAVPLAPLRCM